MWMVVVYSVSKWEKVVIKSIMLIGEYTHIIDDKNRVSLPAKWRRILGRKLVMTPGLDNCLFLFTEKEWAKVSDKLSENASLLSSDIRSFTRFMYGGAFEAPIYTPLR